MIKAKDVEIGMRFNFRGDKTGRIIANDLKAGDEYVAVEFDSGIVTVQNVNDLEIIPPPRRFNAHVAYDVPMGWTNGQALEVLYNILFAARLTNLFVGNYID